jgi:hypothetical protein
MNIVIILYLIMEKYITLKRIFIINQQVQQDILKLN